MYRCNVAFTYLYLLANFISYRLFKKKCISELYLFIYTVCYNSLDNCEDNQEKIIIFLIIMMKITKSVTIQLIFTQVSVLS